VKSKRIKKNSERASNWGTVSALFHELMELPAAKRRVRLNAIGEESKRLRREVEALLASSRDIAGFLEDPIGPRVARSLRPVTALSPGQEVGGFEIVRELGYGAFATVYLAREKTLDRLVALKISPDTGHEARTMARLEHEFIVTVFSEARTTKPALRLVAMKYVAGASFERLLEALDDRPAERRDGKAMLETLGRLCPDEVPLDATALRDWEALAATNHAGAITLLGIDLAQALAHAHGKGVLHLDVKPSNILVNRYGRPMLTDFNVSLDARVPSDPGALGGTFAYMAPEQQEVFRATDREAAIAKLDGRADVYSLGVVLREALGDAPIATELRHTLDRATHPDRDKRFPNAEALEKALRCCVDLASVRRALPEDDWITRSSARYPLAAITLLGALPQVAASLVGTAYNTTRIVSRLSEPQQEVFRLLNLTYSPVLYTIALVFWVWSVMRLAPYLSSPSAIAYDGKAVDQLRRQALRLPAIGIAVTTFGWIPGAFLFPLVITYQAGPLDVAVVGHFILSFLLSWLIAMAYSYLLHQSVTIRSLYPRFWVGAQDLSQTARRELGGLTMLLRTFSSLTALIPLVGAALLLSQGPDMFDAMAYRDFRMLVTALITLGAMGAAFALSTSQKLVRAVVAFTGDSRA
jgi:eukaryotic-like serine/threonine-protein kinase